MKSINETKKLFFYILIFLFFGIPALFGQNVTETFEDETTNNQDFSGSGYSFTTNSLLKIGFFTNGGSSGTGDHRFLEATPVPNSGIAGEILWNTPAGEAFQLESLFIYVSDNGGNNTFNGPVTFNGTIFGGGTASASFNVVHPSSFGYDFLDFTGTALDGVNLTKVEVVLDNDAMDYVSIDNFNFNKVNPNDVSVTINDLSIAEGNSGNTPFNFTVTRSNNNTAFSVTAQSANGSASAGSDFTALPATLVNFTMGGPLTQTVTVNAFGDFDPESDENFFVNLTTPTNGAVILDPQGEGNILDDDTVCETFEDEAMAGLTAFSQNGIDFSTTNELVTGFFAGGGSTGSDYYLESDITMVPHSGSVGEIQVTTANKVFEVLQLDLWLSTDNDPEDSEIGNVSFIGTLAGGGTATAVLTTTMSGGSWSPNLSFSGTPLDGALLTGLEVELQAGGTYVAIDNFKFAAFDNNSVLVSIDNVCMDEGDTGNTNFVFTVSRNNTTTAFDVTVQSANGTATAGSDYTAFGPAVLNFTANGAASQTVTVVVSGDTNSEDFETFEMNLSNPTNGAVIASGQGIGTIKDDDTTCETFEDEGMVDLIAFSEDGVDFASTDQLVTDFFAGGGGQGSDYYLDSEITAIPHSGSVGEIQVTTPGVAIKLLRLDFWLSDDIDPEDSEAGTLRLIGSIAGGGTATADLNGPATGGSWNENISLTGTPLDGLDLISIEVELLGNSNYVALDNICFEEVVLCDLVVNCPGAPPVIEGCGATDVEPTSSLAYSTVPITITEAQFIAEGGSITTSNNITSISYQDAVTGGPGNYPVIVTRTFSVTDDCIITTPVTCTQVFTINDTTDPVLNCENATVCNDAGLCEANVSIIATANDNCTIVTETYSGIVTPVYGVPYGINGTGLDASGVYPVGTVSITFTVIDQAGNMDNCMTEITINDCEAPVISLCPNDVTQPNVPGDCYQTLSWNIPTSSDNCNVASFVRTTSDPTLVINDLGSFSFATFPVGTTTVTYTATDDGGNVTVCSFDVTIVDTEAPMANCQDITVSLDPNGEASITANSINNGSTDNCPVITMDIDVSSFNCTNIGLNPVTLTVTDNAGLVSECISMVTVESASPPIFTAPANLCVNAGIQAGVGGGSPVGGVYSGPGVTDDGNGMTYSFDPAAAGVGIHILTYTYTDPNGCTESATDDVEILALPTVNFTALADLCVNSGVQNNLGGGSPVGGIYSGTGVTDDGNGMTYDFDPVAAGVGTHTITYTFTDGNGCINSASDDVEVFALPTVIFTAPALAVCVDDATVTGLGGGMPSGGIYNGTGVTDDGNGMTFRFNPTASAPNGGNVSVTYTYTDVNGCTNSATDDIFVNPICCEFTATCPTATDLGDFDCTQLGNIPAHPTTEAEVEAAPYNMTIGDAPCGTIVVLSVDDITNLDVCAMGGQTITRTVTVFDDLDGGGTLDGGEQSQVCTYTFGIVEDTTIPEVTCAEFTETFSGCPDPIGPNTPTGNWVEIPANGMINTAVGGVYISTLDVNSCIIDNCSQIGDMEYMLSDSYEENRIPGNTVDIINEFMIRDACGNISPVKFNFRGTIQFDGPGPVIECPASGIVECASDISVSVLDAVVSSGCGTPSVSLEGPVINGSPDCSGTTYTYTYTATDGRNQMASCTQVFTIENDPPTIVCPANMTVECFADIAVDPDDAVVVTSCALGSTVVITGPVQVGSADCPGTTYTYTYTVTDDCGRTASCEQVFTIENDPPTIVCPANMTVECFADIAIDPDDAVVVTSCALGSTVVITGPVQVGSADCPGTTYTYTYTVTDDCGRTASCEQVFTIENDPPTIVCPADQIVECASDIIVSADNATVTTSCTLGSTTALTGPVIDGQADCPGTTYTYTYIVTDDCGRTASCEQVFTIQNDEPTVTCPADQVVECFDDIVVDPNDLIVSTSCGLGYFAYVKQPLITGGIPGCDGTVYTYIYVVVDDCGRRVECEQQFLIQNEAPTVSVPAGGTVECFSDIEVSTADASVSTACPDQSYDVYLLPVEINGPIDCPGTTYTYTYRVIDNCVRTVEVQRVFTNGQNAGPTIEAPVDVEVTCLGGVNINPDQAVVTTSCGGDGYQVEVSGPEIQGPMDCSGTRYLYTYTVTDECGRSASDVRTFTVNNEGPVFVNCEEDTWLQFNCEDYGGEAGTIAAIEAYIASVEAYSACGSQLAVFNNFNANNINTCINNGINSITFRATDNCGRTTLCKTTYVVVDTEAPEIYEEAQDHWEICNYNSPQNFQDWVNAQGGAAAYDACSSDNVFWSTIPANPTFSCAGASGITSTTVTFVVRDNCGNSTTTSATFNTFESGGIAGGEDETIQVENQAGSSMELFQNRPNPFKGETVISFQLPKEEAASLMIFDMSGKMIKLIEGEFNRGYNEVTVNRNIFPGSGVFFYRLMTEEGTATKKMILID